MAYAIFVFADVNEKMEVPAVKFARAIYALFMLLTVSNFKLSRLQVRLPQALSRCCHGDINSVETSMNKRSVIELAVGGRGSPGVA